MNDDIYFEEINRPRKKLPGAVEINLGKHENHEWEVVTDVPSPHIGKIICKTCGGKWVTWLPKGSI